jgi:hypothetical protein
MLWVRSWIEWKVPHTPQWVAESQSPDGRDDSVCSSDVKVIVFHGRVQLSHEHHALLNDFAEESCE